MIEQIISSWLELKHAESLSAAAPEGSLEQARFRLKRLESAERRHMNALKSLATLRALLPGGVAPAKSIKLFDPASGKKAI